MRMEIQLKQNISKELLFLPTVLLILKAFTSILFDQLLFGDSLSANLTIMLVSGDDNHALKSDHIKEGTNTAVASLFYNNMYNNMIYKCNASDVD